MLNETRARLDSVAVIYDKTEGDTAKEALQKQFNSILEKHRRASIAYLLTHYNSLSSLYAIYQQYAPDNYVFYKTTDLQYFKILTDSLSKYHPKSPHVAALKSFSNRRLSELKTEMLKGLPGVKVNQLPEIELPDYAGDTVSLASLKGKLVLLTFWVSGSQDCVNNNLELKKIYQKYRNRGFEIFQVSFDSSVQTWQKAVKFDELPWISVIEAGNSTILAGNYNITALPANYLIDRDNASIVAKNLTPDQLQAKLQQMN
jgi:peroxiredoxin